MPYPISIRGDLDEPVSRWLFLVKLLLLIPHFFVLTVFRWGGEYVGLITLLVLIAAVARLFTGRYPNGIFDFIIRLNRWSYRVEAYLLLMTDRYPPFRLEE